MEKDTEIPTGKENSVKTGICKEINNTLKWDENITMIDFAGQRIPQSTWETLTLPASLETLNISRNNLDHMPTPVMNLTTLKVLDVSFNNIQYFDDTPSFCHTIVKLNLQNNVLFGPPYWVWSETPRNLSHLNLSNNLKVTESFENGYFEELMGYKTLVSHVEIQNCRINKYIGIMSTFCYATELIIGSADFTCFAANHLEQVPCVGLDKCYDVQLLNLSNTKIYTINSNIDIYKNIKEIDLSLNNLESLPVEFCNLENLESCVLSFNDIVYLPDDLPKLKMLKKLYVDNNQLCMLPDNFKSMVCLETLDLYNNCLYDLVDDIEHISELDFAQNYCEEPEDDDYNLKKEKLRLKFPCYKRTDGKKVEVVRVENERSDCTSDEEINSNLNSDDGGETRDKLAPSSDGEDWDSDEYWVPHPIRRYTPPKSPWLYFVKKKMSEGNFCPMDLHTVPIAEQVRDQKMINPSLWIEAEGQFDDLSDDQS